MFCKLKKIFLSIFGLLLVFVLTISLVNVSVFAVPGIGSVKDSYSYTILKDMTYTYTDSNNGSPQKSYVLEYNPATSGVDAIAMFGEYEFGGDQISKNVALAESLGYTVIAGVNASPFDTSNGVTVGTIIQNGRVVSANSGRSGYDSFAIRNDGTMFIGTSNLSMSYTTSSGKTININTINKQKKTDNNNIYLYTSDYATDTKTLVNSVEVTLSYVSGDLSIGKEIKLKVESVETNKSRSSLSDGKYVLVGPSTGALGDLSLNEEITVNITSKDTTYNWNEVANSICGFYQILKDGSVMSNIDADSVVHPRTTIGFKANGEIVLYVVDGRQPNFSIGLSDRACAEYMASLGCVDAIRMDGGGSSAMTIRLPGDTTLTTVNSPSDGGERSDSDCLLLVLKDDYDTTVKDDYLLHAYPNSIKLLENTVTEIKVKATDSNYNPKQAPQVNYEIIDNCGEMVGGKFKAASGTVNGKIKISCGDAETYVNVNVSDKVSELYCNVNNLALGPGDKYSLVTRAYYNNELLLASNESFEWSCDANIGTIDNKGNFSATTNAGNSGYIYAKFGSVQAKVLVTVGQLPIEITGFENDSCGSGSGEWRNNQVNGGSGSCSINTDLEYVKYGSKSLKINFNLANTTGTVGTQIWTGSKLKIDGSPTAIGMWVYATPSAKGAWIRMQYTESGSSGAKYADFGDVNWTGWKYLEAPIDTTVTYPVYIQYLVRIMGVNESQRIDGVIYVDGLRAVYGFTNDDFENPVINNLTPGENGFAELTTQTVSFDVVDTGVGVNIEKTKFYLDGTEITNLITKEITNGYNVSWTPSALIPLANGHHTVKVRCEDHASNFAVKEWDIFIGAKAIDFYGSENEIVGMNQKGKYTISATDNDFSSVQLVLSFNKEDIEEIEVEYAEGIKSTREIINNTKQLITIYFDNESYTGDGKDLVTIKFNQAKQEEFTTEIKFDSLSYTRNSYPDYTFTAVLDDYQVEFKNLIDYTNFINLVNKYFETTDFEDLYVAYNESKNYDFSSCTDEIALEAYNNLQNSINLHNQFLASFNNVCENASKVGSKLGGR